MSVKYWHIMQFWLSARTLSVHAISAQTRVGDMQPATIFVDIMMPRIDGCQTCALIKKNSAFKMTPVIMISSKDGLFDRAKGRIVGSDQYSTKPFSKVELLSAIRDHIKMPEYGMTKVLVVDDSPAETYQFKGMLESLGYEVITAENGKAGGYILDIAYSA